MSASVRFAALLVASTAAACSLFAEPINEQARQEAGDDAGAGGETGSGGSGGTGQGTKALGVVEAVVGGEHRVFDFRTGGVTPDQYTMIVAEDAAGQALEISFDGNVPGTYACGAAVHTSVEYAADAMQATSALDGACAIQVVEVGALGEPIRGTFTARLASAGGQAVDVTEGRFDVTNEIP